MKLPAYAYLLLIVISVFLGCRSPQSEELCKQADGHKKSGKVFLVGEDVIKSKVLNDIIRVSGLNTRGYSLILTSGYETGSQEISDLVNALHYFKINANHILPISDNLQIKTADEIALRNAQVIFLAFNSRSSHASFLADPLLTAAVKHAFADGKSIVGIGPGAGLLGEITVTSTLNPQTAETEIQTTAGLNFLPGTLVDKERFFVNHKDLVMKFAAENPRLFLGIGRNSFVHYCNQELSVKSHENLIVIKGGELLDQSEIAGLKNLKTHD